VHSLYFNFACGLLVGTYGSLVGVGGGFLLVPLFLLAYGLSPEAAAGTSLAIVTMNAFSGTISYLRQGKVDLREGCIYALGTVPSAVLGAALTAYFSPKQFNQSFGAMLLLLSVYLVFRKRGEKEPFSGKTGFGWVSRETNGKRYQVHEPTGLGFSFLVGLLSSLMGLGGGIFHVPILSLLMRVPVHIAVATSQFVLVFTALTGAIAHGSKGNLVWPIVLWTGAGAVIGAQLGAHFAKHVNATWLLRFLALALFVVGLRLLF
jgi:uncharacterized membrane protein YfcA